jgi:hypothetical protein
MSSENILITLDFLSAIKVECNLSDNHKKNLIILLSKLSLFLGNKCFKEITRDDLLRFLDSLHKSESSDPLHKWIGTYNLYRVLLVRFFKWLYHPDIEQDKYLHYFGNESSESILEAYGILTTNKEVLIKSKPKQCPNCSEQNKPDSKFCAKCRMILSYDAYTETIEQKENQADELNKMKERQEKFELVIQSLIDSGQLKPKN